MGRHIRKFFRHGFYVSLAVWMYGICFSMSYDGSVVIKVVAIIITFCIYLFFAVGKIIMESKYGE